MNILIAGAGQVGFRLAKTLCRKDNVILMDKNQEALEKISDTIDVMTITGNVEDPHSYQIIEDMIIDIFVAVTDTDETNLIASIIVSEKIEIKQKIIRLKKEFFAKSSIAHKIGITDAIFPYMLTAKTTSLLVDYPKVNNIKTFSGTDFKLFSIKVNNDTHDLSVNRINNDFVKVIGIGGQQTLNIPKEDTFLKKGDIIYLVGKTNQIEKLCRQLNDIEYKKIKNIAIFGADLLGIEIAKELVKKNMNVKIIEKNMSKCKLASDVLKNGITIINDKYDNCELYNDEGLRNADMVIASTYNDEENIIKCIEAKEQGVRKVVAINNDIKYYNLMHSLGVVVVRGPKVNAFYSIIETIGSNELVNEKLFCGGLGISFIRQFKDINKVIQPVCLDNAVSFIVKNERIEELAGKKNLESNDIMISFSSRECEEKVGAWINNL